MVAANVDVVFIVMSLNEDFNLRRLERYMTMAWESGAQPVIVLTKTDLCPDWELRVLEVEAIAFGVPVHAVSNITGEGLDLVRAHLTPGRTVALLGSSGVGKSTLVNALAGEELLATQEIREDDGEGRHTTTHRELVLLPDGGLVLDTPGMRELQLWESSDGIAETFSDVEELAAQCRFSDCAHGTEPGLRRAGGDRGRDAPVRALGELQEAAAGARAPRAPARQAPPGRGAEALGEGRRPWAARTCARRDAAEAGRRRAASAGATVPFAQPTFAAPWVDGRRERPVRGRVVGVAAVRDPRERARRRCSSRPSPRGAPCPRRGCRSRRRSSPR